MSFEDEVRNAFTRADESIERVPLDWTATFEKARRGHRNYLAAVAVGAAAVIALGAFVAMELLGATGREGQPPAGTQTDEAPPPTSTPTSPAELPSKEPLLLPAEGVEDGECSAAKDAREIAPVDGETHLPQQVFSMRANIIYSAWDCDYERLAELALAGRSEFTYDRTRPGIDLANTWRRLEEERGEPFTAMLVRILTLPYYFDSPSDFLWPSWGATPEDLQPLVELGVYTREQVRHMQDEFGVYNGPQVHIDRNGDWVSYTSSAG